MIPPGSMIGVLGGGQLGAMFAVAARRMGYRVAVWDPDPNAPGLTLAELPVSLPFDDPDGLRRFVPAVRGVTYEWENVPADLCRRIEQAVPVRPSAEVLRIVQNRLTQKRHLAERGIAVTPFREARTTGELARAGEVGFPCLCKTATTGYDGKGQWRLEDEAALRHLQGELEAQGRSAGEWIVERWVPFEREVSVLVVRGGAGEVRVYPPAENVHEHGILRTTRVPADLPGGVVERATGLARAAVEALQGVGVFCVELFELPDGELFVNEIAPRPHNSGHYTLDACTVSQFEQQVRVLCGLPPGEARLLTPAVMLNLLGDEAGRLQSAEGVARLLSIPGAKLHVYGKTPVRPRRKMGHVTFVSEKLETAWEAMGTIRTWLQDAGAAWRGF